MRLTADSPLQAPAHLFHAQLSNHTPLSSGLQATDDGYLLFWQFKKRCQKTNHRSFGFPVHRRSRNGKFKRSIMKTAETGTGSPWLNIQGEDHRAVFQCGQKFHMFKL